MLQSYYTIFEERLDKIKADIRRLKKDKGVKREHLRRLGMDAKRLRSAIKSAKKDAKKEIAITISKDNGPSVSEGVHLLDFTTDSSANDGYVEMTVRILAPLAMMPNISGGTP
jgi:hypothetical protein